MTTPIFHIIFEDQDILLVEKKKAFISQRGDEGGQEALYEFIARQLKVELWPVHRLDREVLGLMVFGKSQRAAEELSTQFRERKTRKSYSAWVQGRPRNLKDRLVHYLKKNSDKNHTTVFPKPTPGAKEAILEYEVLEYIDSFSRLRVDLETGRSHQIRAQLSKIGHPIVGDQRYRGTQNQNLKETFPSEIQLKSIRLGIFHPRNQQFLEWNLPPLPYFLSRS